MVGGNFNLNDLMKNAKSLMDKAQEKLSKVTATGESGAGLVRVTLNAQHEVTELKLDDSLLKEPKDVIEDLIKAAINDASHKIAKVTQENMLSLGNMLQEKEKSE
jgi:hypothetical protein